LKRRERRLRFGVNARVWHPRKPSLDANLDGKPLRHLRIGGRGDHAPIEEGIERADASRDGGCYGFLGLE
jgi:hypothetical protein